MADKAFADFCESGLSRFGMAFKRGLAPADGAVFGFDAHEQPARRHGEGFYLAQTALGCDSRKGGGGIHETSPVIIL